MFDSPKREKLLSHRNRKKNTLLNYRYGVDVSPLNWLRAGIVYIGAFRYIPSNLMTILCVVGLTTNHNVVTTQLCRFHGIVVLDSGLLGCGVWGLLISDVLKD